MSQIVASQKSCIAFAYTCNAFASRWSRHGCREHIPNGSSQSLVGVLRVSLEPVLLVHQRTTTRTMAQVSWLKLYDANGTFIASFRHAEDASLVATNYYGSTIRDGHQKRRTLWTEGNEETTGGESADRCAKIIYQRLDALRIADAQRLANRKVLTGDAAIPGRQFLRR